jgi:iron complex outermembrane receptor protein
LFANGLALGYLPANTFSGGTKSNKAVFLEMLFPITSPKQGIFGFHQLDVNASVRYEMIDPGGHATKPKFGVRWLPFDDSFAVRSTYSKGFIAPSILTLFGPPSDGGAGITILEGDGSTGAGGSTGKILTNQFVSTVELSNPLAKPSNSESFTAGIVFSPRQVKGFSLTLDYYSIKQDKIGDIEFTSVFADLNAKGSGSKYASGFVFADNTRLTTTAPNQVTSTNIGTITIAANPSGDLKTDGLDLGVDYTFNTGLGRFDIGANANVLFNFKGRTLQTLPYQQYARVFTDGKIGLGLSGGLLPSYIIKPYINHKVGALSTSLFFTYYPKVNAPGSLFGGQSDTNDERLDGKVYTIPAYLTVDLALSYTLPNFGQTWARNFTLTVGANNLFDKPAPYVPGDGFGEAENNTAKSAYDIIGRFMFVELKKSF